MSRLQFLASVLCCFAASAAHGDKQGRPMADMRNPDAGRRGAPLLPPSCRPELSDATHRRP